MSFALSFWALFVVMHLRSLGWSTASLLDRSAPYMDWFGRWVVPQSFLDAIPGTPAGSSHRLCLLAAFALPAALYLLLLRDLRRSSRGPRLGTLLLVATAASLPLLFMPRLLSADVYNYIANGRIAAIHGANPYLVAPEAFPDDPATRLAGWPQEVTSYGPAWVGLSAVLAWILDAAGAGLGASVLAFKILGLAAHLASGALLWSLLGRWLPQERAFGAALWLWNPLALVEFAGCAHKDALMIALLLGGIRLAVAERRALAVLSLALATLVKWAAAPMLVLYAVVLLREPAVRVRRALMVVGVTLLAGLALYAPFWEGWKTVRVLTIATGKNVMYNSLGEVVVSGIAGGKAAWEDTTPSVARLRTGARLLTAGIVALALFLAARRSRDLRSAVSSSAWVFFVLAAIGALWFWPWYATWFLALAPLAGDRAATRVAVLFSLLAPLIYVLTPAPVPVAWSAWRAVLVFVPPIVWALALMGRRRFDPPPARC